MLQVVPVRLEGPDAAELQVRRPVPIEGDHSGLEQPRAGDGGRRRARLAAARGAEEASIYTKGAAQTTACCCVLLWDCVGH
jgi:outer membrane protein TolC